MRSVFVVDLRHGGQIPRDVRDALDLMGWRSLQPGVAYVLDWREAIDAPCPGSVWDRIELVLRVARRWDVEYRLLTMRPGEKIPIGM